MDIDMIEEIRLCLLRNSISMQEFANQTGVENAIYGNYIPEDARVIDCYAVSDSYDIVEFLPSLKVLDELNSILERFNHIKKYDDNPLIEVSFIYPVNKFLSISHQDLEKDFIFMDRGVRHESMKQKLVKAFKENLSNLNDIMEASNVKAIEGLEHYKNYACIDAKLSDISSDDFLLFEFSDSLEVELSNIIGSFNAGSMDEILNLYGLNYLLEIYDDVFIGDGSILPVSEFEFTFIRSCILTEVL